MREAGKMALTVWGVITGHARNVRKETYETCEHTRDCYYATDTERLLLVTR
jgi:hypothetical protein